MHPNVLGVCVFHNNTPQGWWNALDELDADRVAEKRRMQAEEAAKMMKDPALSEGEEEEEMDDIFTDLMKEEEAEVRTAVRTLL